MLFRAFSVINDGLDAPRIRAELARVRKQRWEDGHEIIRLREDLAAALRRATTAELAAAAAGDDLRSAHAAVADAAALRHRLAFAPHPDAHIIGCWTLGGHDATLAAAAGESDLGVAMLAPPTVTLRDLGACDAARVHAAKGCGRAAMSRAALTLRLAGVVANPSWSRWLR